MRKTSLNQFTNGWFIGNFAPSVHRNEEFEICVKDFRSGEIEKSHFQRVATEITVVLFGRVRMGEMFLKENDILIIEKNEVCDFEAITDCKVLGIKFPSIPDDKVLS